MSKQPSERSERRKRLMNFVVLKTLDREHGELAFVPPEPSANRSAHEAKARRQLSRCPRWRCDYFGPVTRYMPMPLERRRDPFDHPDWIFELKYDGFRALLSIGSQLPEFISRNKNTLARFANLARFVERELDACTVLDGEVVCFDSEVRPRLYELMLGRGDPAFVVFDVLAPEGLDLRHLAPIERKNLLRRLIPRRSSFVLFADFIDARGRDYYRLLCGRDLEGIVAQWKAAPYRPDVTASSWIKIKNPEYSQARDRAELFHRDKS
jgi:bifunctional non-homologous end joining protein LigD